MTSDSDFGSDSFFNSLKALLNWLARILDEAGIRIDAFNCEIEAWKRAQQARFAHDPAAAASALKTARTLVRTEAVMAAEAARGAFPIHTLPNPDGSARVVIDGRTAELTPMLAYLFEALISDTGPSDDEFVPWKSVDQIKKMITKKSDTPVSRHALDNLVSRLRKALREQANLHPKFIQRHAQRGLRFALRRQGFQSGEGVNKSPNGTGF